jgi:type II secretory pathway pseudopilin PulG
LTDLPISGSELPKETKVRLLKSQSGQQGFGILEIVVTLFIIGVTLLLFVVVSNSVVLNKYNRYKEVALRIAEHELQTLRTTSYANLPASGAISNTALADLPQGAGTITITEEDTGFAEATVTVTWLNPSGSGNQQLTLSTYLWQGGLGK